jgi:hypothetical protein
MFKKIKPSIRENIFIYGAGLITTFFSFIYFSIKGYPLVNTATEVLIITTPPLYMIIIFFPYGMLLGEIILIWNEKRGYKVLILYLTEFIIIGILSFIRYVVIIPFSGHSIIIFYYLAHQVLNNERRYYFRIIIGITILSIVFIFKIFLWNDPLTFIFGGVIGLAIWLPGFLYYKKRLKSLI